MNVLRTALASAAFVPAYLIATVAFAEMQFEHVLTIGTQGDGEGQFSYVEDFAFTPDGHLLVTDAAHAYVQAFDKTTGEFLGRFGGKGDFDEHLEKPEGISVAPDGRIFVADYTTGYVKVYDASYEWLFTFSEYGEAPGQNIKSEFTDIRNGLYYMPEAGNHRVNVWDLDGNFQFTWGSLGTAEGELNNPESAKFNSEGVLYVADLNNHRIQVFDEHGTFLFGFGSEGSGPGQLSKPAGIGFDADDNVYVSEIGNSRVSVFAKDGTYLTTFGSAGSETGQFGNLHGLIVDASTGWIYVADTENNRVQVFRATGVDDAS